MRYKNILSLALLLFGSYSISFSQIQYKIDLLNGEDLYQVSLVSAQDFVYPNNVIGTAQVSIKAPLSGFQLGEVTSLLEEVTWENNAVITAPKEAAGFQYLSIGLASSGTSLPLKKGLEVPLFTFKNIVGRCPGAVALVDNKQDAFITPNSRNANIGNQITPFGCLNLVNKNAYSGNIAGGVADCGQLTSMETLADELIFEMDLSPNPTQDWLNLDIHTTNLKEDMFIQIWETGGKLLRQERITRPFSNAIKRQESVSAFAAGNYSILLSQGNSTKVKHFVKILK